MHTTKTDTNLNKLNEFFFGKIFDYLFFFFDHIFFLYYLFVCFFLDDLKIYIKNI
jgi:hypothetical protein